MHTEQEAGLLQAEVLRLDDGIELLGKYRGSGLQEPPYLLRRGDGQVVQVSRLLYLIAAAFDPHRHPHPDDRQLAVVAQRVSTRFGQEVSAENVAYLVDRKLRPAGLVTGGAPAPDLVVPDEGPGRANPLLALRLRLPMVPERAHRVISSALEPLFSPVVVVATLVALVVLDVWLITGQRHELSAGARQIIYQPQLLLGITVLTIVAGAFHEIGHAAAARYSGATPGAMGAGIYLVWPVFYTDVTDAYRLDRVGRLRTDLGGVYFNVVFALGIASLYLQTDYRPLLVFVVIVQFETLRQFLPFVRLDGYYVVSDLAGVPNLFAYMRPVLTTLLRRGDDDARRAARAKLDELNPRARALVYGWVCLTAPVLLVHVVGFLMVTPRLAGAAWGSAGGQLREMTTNGHIDVVGVVNGIVGVLLLTLPVVGMSYVFTRLAVRLSHRARSWWATRPLATATVAGVAVSLIALQVAAVWPDTFASALRNAQVAQALEDARDEGRIDEFAGAPHTPAAEPAPVAAADMPDPDAGPGTAPPSSQTGESTGEPGSSTTATGSTRSASSPSSTTSRPAADDGRTVDEDADGDTPSTTTPSSTTSPIPSESRETPRGGGAGGSTGGGGGGGSAGGGGGSPRTTTTTRPPTTTTTAPPPPAEDSDLLDDLLGWIF